LFTSNLAAGSFQNHAALSTSNPTVRSFQSSAVGYPSDQAAGFAALDVILAEWTWTDGGRSKRH
jgi:hypothetical protein